MREFDRGKIMSPEARLVLLVARWVVNKQGAPEIKNLLAQGALKWTYVNDLLIHHALLPFAYSCLKDYLFFIPSVEIELYKKYQHFSLINLVYLEKEFLKIADVFLNNNIELVPIKGMAFLIDKMYDDKSYLRPMTDIDILVKEQKLEQIEILLNSLGYGKELDGKKEEYWRKRNYHLLFTKMDGKRSYKLEAHWLLDYPRKIPLLSSLWDRTRKCKWKNKEISLFSHEDTLFCLTLHLRRFGNTLSLKSACDFAILLNKYKELDWDYILREARRGHVRASLYFMLTQASLLFEVKAPTDVFKNLCMPNYKKNLIQDFILRNTFLEQLCFNSKNGNRASLIYLNNHFLVYDNFLEPVKMIINIPQEQFATFYNMPVYFPGTKILYKLRFFYFPYNFFTIVLKAVIRKVVKWNKK